MPSHVEEKPQVDELKRKTPLMSIIVKSWGGRTNYTQLLPKDRGGQEPKIQSCTCHLKKKTVPCCQRRCMRCVQRVGKCLCCPYAQASDGEPQPETLSTSEEQIKQRPQNVCPSSCSHKSHLDLMLNQLRGEVDRRSAEYKTSRLKALKALKEVSSHYKKPIQFSSEKEGSSCGRRSCSSPQCQTKHSSLKAQNEVPSYYHFGSEKESSACGRRSSSSARSHFGNRSARPVFSVGTSAAQLNQQRQSVCQSFSNHVNHLERRLQQLRGEVERRHAECQTLRVKAQNEVPSYYKNRLQSGSKKEGSTCSRESSSSDNNSDLEDLLTGLLRHYKKKRDDSVSNSSKLSDGKSIHSRSQSQCKSDESRIYCHAHPIPKQKTAVKLSEYQRLENSKSRTSQCVKNCATTYSDVDPTWRSAPIKGFEPSTWNSIVEKFENPRNKNKREAPMPSKLSCVTMDYDVTQLQCEVDKNTDRPHAQEAPKWCITDVKTNVKIVFDNSFNIRKCTSAEEIQITDGGSISATTSKTMDVLVCNTSEYNTEQSTNTDSTFMQDEAREKMALVPRRISSSDLRGGSVPTTSQLVDLNKTCCCGGVTFSEVITKEDIQTNHSAGACLEDKSIACRGADFSQEAVSSYKQRQFLEEPAQRDACVNTQSSQTTQTADDVDIWSKMTALFGHSGNEDVTKVLLITDSHSELLTEIGTVSNSPDKDQQATEPEGLRDPVAISTKVLTEAPSSVSRC